ncbi:hypothetical protein ACB092_11G128800 [Castanea dentata]
MNVKLSLSLSQLPYRLMFMHLPLMDPLVPFTKVHVCGSSNSALAPCWSKKLGKRNFCFKCSLAVSNALKNIVTFVFTIFFFLNFLFKFMEWMGIIFKL